MIPIMKLYFSFLFRRGLRGFISSEFTSFDLGLGRLFLGASSGGLLRMAFEHHFYSGGILEPCYHSLRDLDIYIYTELDGDNTALNEYIFYFLFFLILSDCEYPLPRSSLAVTTLAFAVSIIASSSCSHALHAHEMDPLVRRAMTGH